MSFLGLGKNSGNKIIAVLDFSSSSVGGILIRQNKQDIPEVIYCGRSPVNFLFDVDFEAFWRCSKKALDEIFFGMLKSYPSGPDSVLCVFNSPWFISEARIVDVQKKEGFKITKKFLREIMETEEKEFEKEISSRFSSLKIQPEILEHEFMKAELNGYYTEFPMDKFAKVIKIYIYVSMGIKQAMNQIKKEILKQFGNTPVVFKSFPLLFLRVFKSIINTKEGFILINISGETTDAVLIKNNNLEEFFSIPCGKNFLLRKLSAKSEMSLEQTESIIRTSLKGHAEETNSMELRKSIENSLNEWNEALYKVFLQMAETRPLPQQVFFLGEGIINEEFAKSIQMDRFAKLSVSGNFFQITFILPEALNHYLKFLPSATLNKNDSCLIAESLFANKIL